MTIDLYYIAGVSEFPHGMQGTASRPCRQANIDIHNHYYYTLLLLKRNMSTFNAAGTKSSDPQNLSREHVPEI